jgi:hypothetical protein
MPFKLMYLIVRVKEHSKIVGRGATYKLIVLIKLVLTKVSICLKVRA